MKHQKFIDGLRAIAVMFVFVFHLEPKMFSSGYLGVDIFFVISGFVITGSLYKEFLQRGQIKIFTFYKKRFKRLYPILIVVIITTLICYFLFGNLNNSLFIRESAFASLFGFSNFYYLLKG